MKTVEALLFFALAILLFCTPLTLEAKAAEESPLTFTLNEDGKSYAVSGCKEDATGETTIPAAYEGLPVTAIGDSAFSGCHTLTEIIIPDSVTSLGSSAFSGCSALTKIAIPGSITTIASSAFSECSSLTDVTICEGVTTLNSNVFYKCENLTNISLPDSLLYFDNAAVVKNTAANRIFYGCDNLQYNIFDSGKYLGNAENPYRFLIDTTSKDITALQIHKDTKVITAQAVSRCTKLTDVIIPEGITDIHGEAFRGSTALHYNIFDNGKYLGSAQNPYFALISPASTDITSLQIHKDTKIIARKAAYFCKELTQVIIPNGITAISQGTFAACNKLTNITIPNSVTSINDDAFFSCDNLTSVTIPNSVTSMGRGVFQGCTALTEITIPDSVTSIGSFAFSYCDALKIIFAGSQKEWESIPDTSEISAPVTFLKNNTAENPKDENTPNKVPNEETDDDNKDQDENTDGLNIGLIIGIAAGSALVGGGIVALIIVLNAKKKKA